MNRRDILKGIAGVAGGLLFPPSVVEAAKEGRRIWALGAMPGRDPRIIDVWQQDFIVSGRFDADAEWTKRLIEHREGVFMFYAMAQVTSAPGPAVGFSRLHFIGDSTDV